MDDKYNKLISMMSNVNNEELCDEIINVIVDSKYYDEINYSSLKYEIYHFVLLISGITNNDDFRICVNKFIYNMRYKYGIRIESNIKINVNNNNLCEQEQREINDG